MGVEVQLKIKHRFWTSAGSCAKKYSDFFRPVAEFPEVLGYLHTGNTRSAVRSRNPVRPDSVRQYHYLA